MPFKKTSPAVETLAVAESTLTAARTKLAAADNAVEAAKNTVATLEAGKTNLALDDEIIGAHLAKLEIARTKLEIAERLRGEADAEVAQAEAAAEAGRKNDLFTRAQAARDVAAEKVRVGYAQLVADVASLREIAAEADALVAESNRIRAGHNLDWTEEYALDLRGIPERVIRTETERRWLFADTGLPVPDVTKIADRGDGVYVYRLSSAQGAGQTHLSPGAVNNLERRVHQPTVVVETYVPSEPYAPGPRLPDLQPPLARPERREHEATRERVVHQPLQGAPRMHAVRAIALGQGAGAA